MARLNKWERQHLKDLSALDKRIEQIYEAAVKEAARIGATISDFNPDRLFSFSDYPINYEKVLLFLHTTIIANYRHCTNIQIHRCGRRFEQQTGICNSKGT